MKRFSADDSAGSRVKVGHRQAITAKTPSHVTGRFLQYLQNGGVEENAKSVCSAAQNCAILQGFADHSKASKRSALRGVLDTRSLKIYSR